MEIEQIFFFLGLFGTGIVFLVGYYVFLKDPRRKINRIFFLMSLAGTLYGIGQIMERSKGGVLWPIIGWIGVSFLPSIFLHLSLVITEKKEILKKKITSILLYFPSFLILSFVFSYGFLLSILEGAIVFKIEKFFTFFFPLYYELYLLIAVVFLVKRHLSFKSIQEKAKFKNFLIGIFISIIGGSIFEVILPFLWNIMAPVPGLLFKIGRAFPGFLFFALGYLFIARGVIRWRLFIDYREILETIFKRLAELIIVTDKEGIILLTNEATLLKFKQREEELIGKKITDLLKGKEQKWKELRERLKREGIILEDKIYFLTKEKEETPFLLTISLTKEGIIFMGRDIREIVSYQEKLEKEVKERTRELEEARTILEIKVRARTRELRELTESLEQRVKERTKELQERLNELKKFHRVTVGRELRMVELKKEIEKLKEFLKSK